MITKKEIKSDITTSKEGRTITHTYYSQENRYDYQTRMFESASNQNRVTDGSGCCVSGILQNKKAFIDWLYNELKTNDNE